MDLNKFSDRRNCSIKDEKKNLRKEILLLRNRLTPEQINEGGKIICDRICAHPYFKTSINILAYCSYGSEVSTFDFLKLCLNLGKNVYLPKVTGKDMIFYRIFSIDELVYGYKNIPEPKGESQSYDYFSDNDCNKHTMILMPGVVFDSSGHRIGYGGGFYDRYLQDKKFLLDRSIAVCYEFQMLRDIPHEEHDLLCNEIITV